MKKDKDGEGGKVIGIDGKPIDVVAFEDLKPEEVEDLECNEVIAELQNMASKNMLQSMIALAITKNGEPILIMSDQSMGEMTFKKDFLNYKIMQRFSVIDETFNLEE